MGRPGHTVIGQMIARSKQERKQPTCFCIGPQPGQTLCPCAIREESDKKILENIKKIYDLENSNEQ